MRAERRYETRQPGIRTLHSFSAGPHYDPDNISFGPVVGLDEHCLDPGAGFDWHAHAGVHIVSWVLDGVLRHEDSHGEVRLVGPGNLLVQSTGTGVRHTETNASSDAALRFVQVTLLGRATPSAVVSEPPARIADVAVDVRRRGQIRGPALVYVLTGDHLNEAVDAYRPGDDLRLTGSFDDKFFDGDGELLVVSWDGSTGS